MTEVQKVDGGPVQPITRHFVENSYLRLLSIDPGAKTIKVKTIIPRSILAPAATLPNGCYARVSLAEFGIADDYCQKGDLAYGTSEDLYTIPYS